MYIYQAGMTLDYYSICTPGRHNTPMVELHRTVWICMYHVCVKLNCLNLYVSESVYTKPADTQMSKSVCTIPVWHLTAWLCMYLNLHVPSLHDTQLSESVCIWICMYQACMTFNCLNLYVPSLMTLSQTESVIILICMYQAWGHSNV